MKKILFFIVLLVTVAVCLTSCGKVVKSIKLSAAEMRHRQDVVASVALAYYNQKTQIFYDQYNSRRNYNSAPEDATAQKNLYFDCSSFVNSVYYYCFGVNLLDGKSVSTQNIDKAYSDKKPDKNGELLFRISGDELSMLKSDTEKANAKLNEIKSTLEPGDIINYRRTNNTGHVVMYLGDRKIIHSTGSANVKTPGGDVNPKTSVEKYSADEKEFGTVTIDDWDRFFTKTVTPKSQNDGRTGTSNNYIFADNISSVVIIRPLCSDRFIQTLLTDSALYHQTYEGLSFEKSATLKRGEEIRDLYYGSSVCAGDKITFTVKIANNSNKVIENLRAIDKIPEGLEYVSSPDGTSYRPDDNSVYVWIKTFEAGKTAEFSYTLSVKAQNKPGDLIYDSETYVMYKKTNPLVFQYCASKPDSSALTTAVTALTGTAYKDGLSAAKAVYEKAYGKAGSDAFNSDISSKTLYGGYKIGSAEISNAVKTNDYSMLNLRVRRVMKNYLEEGDVIVTTSTFFGKEEAMLYLCGSLYGILSDGTFGKLKTSTLSIGASGTLQDFLDTLTAYDEFKVLRPAIQMP